MLLLEGYLQKFKALYKEWPFLAKVELEVKKPKRWPEREQRFHKLGT